MSGISTHVLNTSTGQPVMGVAVKLEYRTAALWTELSNGATDADGRCPTLLGAAPLQAGEYRLTFHTESYFETLQIATLYPEICISFRVRDPRQHHHIPLLLAPFGYTTYRGS